MSTVIFACKSNSCRSQMAEGWAKEWIRKKKDSFDEKLKRVKEGNKTEDCSSIERTISRVDNFVVASVALDSSAVFTTESAQSSLAKKRKSVKIKAIEALAKDGVDISSYCPKTAVELLRLLDEKQIFKKEIETSDSYHEIIARESIPQEEKSHLDDHSVSNEGTKFDDAKIDCLIVLCSCGDDIKYDLIQCSRYVEEWDIEPPTAAANAGEGDGAYRRVSLKIRDRVNGMMDRLLSTS